jgi:DNA-binding CsgD family transcriptional regulator
MNKVYVAREEEMAVQDVSDREMEVLLLIARGMIPREIARSLAISEKTVRNHIGSIYRKIGIYDRAQVVVYAVKKGLIDLSREESCTQSSSS